MSSFEQFAGVVSSSEAGGDFGREMTSKNSYYK
jgi:hypothetical protein